MRKPFGHLERLAAACGLCLLTGCALASALDQSQSTPPAWSGPQGFDLTSPIPAQAPSGAMDPSGNVLLAWDRVVLNANVVWGNAFSASGGWQTPGAFPSFGTSAQNVQVAVASTTGTFFAVWDVGAVPSTNQVWLQAWSASGEFGPDKLLSANPGYAPVVAMDGAGDAVMAWTELLPSGLTAVVAERYTAAGGTFSLPLQLSTTLTANAFAPLVGLDPAGNAVVQWTEAVDTVTGPYTVETARFLASTQLWSAPFCPQVAAANPASPYGALAMTAYGARAAWSESTDGTTFQLYSASYAPATDTWSAPVRVSAAGLNALQPALGQDAAGNALLAWVQWTQGATPDPAPDLYATAYSVGTGWLASPSGVSTGTPGVYAPALSMAPDGHGALAWQQYDGTHWRIAASLNAPGYGWSATALVQAATGGDALFPGVYIGTLDRVLVTWSQTDASGVSHVYANLYQ